jgi:HlyD family secretion protein
VLTSDAVRIDADAQVTLVRWGGEPLQGRVRHVEPSAFARLSALGVEEQRVNVLIDLISPRERWRGLGDGYRVEAQIAVWEACRGLEPGERVVLHPSDRVTDGIKVAVR